MQNKINIEQNSQKKILSKKVFWVIFASIFIGFFNGFFGGGGGMICVPLLQKVLGIKNKKAHATTIAVIAVLSIVSSVFYVSKNQFDWNMILFVAVGVFFGGVFGAIFLKKFSSNLVKFLFAILMAIAGIQMVIFS